MVRLLDPTGREAPVEDMLAFDAAIAEGLAAHGTPLLVSGSSESASTGTGEGSPAVGHAAPVQTATITLTAAAIEQAADEAVAAMMMSPPNIVREHGLDNACTFLSALWLEGIKMID
jgi:hypothetical protein